MRRDSWDEKVQLLLKYLEEHNNEYPECSEYYEGVGIGSWINTQRTIYNNGEKKEDGTIVYNCFRLTKERIDKLNSINFKWQAPNKKNTNQKWQENYEKLKKYLTENKGNYPKSNEIYKGLNIGQWINTQRLVYSKGEKLEDGTIRYKTHFLTEERIQKLNEINFRWSHEKSFSWLNKYYLLIKYLKEHNGEYPYQYEYYEDVAIGSWVNTQRTIYNNGEKKEDGSIKYKSNILTKEKIDMLNEIGFIWSLHTKAFFQDAWMNNYKIYCEYLEEYDGKYPDSNTTYKGIKIGQWIIRQRTIYNNGKILEDGSVEYKGTTLSKERIELLNKVDFDRKNLNDISWDDKYNLLVEYLKEHNGNYPSIDEQYKGIYLGKWIIRQRSIFNCGIKDENGIINHNFGILTKERIDKLNKINFKWSNYYSWDFTYNLLVKFINEHNGEYPTDELYEDVDLLKWLNLQRLIYNNGEKCSDGIIRYRGYKLTQERIEKLNDIDFSWTKLNVENWNQKYELLVEYLNEHEGKYPNRDEEYKNVKLGIWICDLRNIYSNGKKMEDGSIRYDYHVLTKERIDRLNKIGFPWVLYKEKDYITKIKTEKKKALIQKKLLYKLYKELDKAQNEIKTKEDVKQIEKEFVKSLTIFDFL